MEFSESLSRILDARHLRQADLCRMAGIQSSAMSDYVLGKKEPTLSRAAAMADALQISLDELAGRATPKRVIERELLANFRELNDEGQETAVNIVYGMRATYKKTYEAGMGKASA